MSRALWRGLGVGVFIMSLSGQQAAGNDVALNFGRAFVDPHDPQVADMAFQREVAGEAIAAVDLQCRVGDTAGGFGGEQLGLAGRR